MTRKIIIALIVAIAAIVTVTLLTVLIHTIMSSFSTDLQCTTKMWDRIATLTRFRITSTIVATKDVTIAISNNRQPQVIPICIDHKIKIKSTGSFTAVRKRMIANAPIVPRVITKFDCKHKIIVEMKNGSTAMLILNALL